MEKPDEKITDYTLNPINDGDRKVTDKHGVVLLLFTFSVWAVSCGYVFCNEFYSSQISIKNTQVGGNIEQYFKKNTWLFDVLTYNFTFCNNYRYLRNDHISQGIEFIFLGYNLHAVPFLSLLLLSSQFSKRKHYFLFYMCIIVMTIIGLVPISIVYRIGLNIVSDLIPDQMYYEKMVSWITPELILCIVILIALLYMFHVDATSAYSALKTIFQVCCDLYCVTIFAIFLVAIMLSIKIFTTALINDLDWTHVLLYIILSGSFYVAFFIYNFGNAVITTAIWHTHGKRGPVKAFLLSIFTVIKYHLGSVAVHSTVVLPLLLIKHEISKIEFEMNSSNNIEMIKQELKSEPSDQPVRPWIIKLPDLDVVYVQKYPRPKNDKLSSFEKNVMLAWEFLKKKYNIIKVFNRSLIFIVVYGLSYRDSTKIISFRYLAQEKVPRSKIFLRGWLIVHLLLNIIHETSCFVLLFLFLDHYNNHRTVYVYKLPSFRFAASVAYNIKIAIVTFLLGMMIIDNCELIANLRYVETKDKCQEKDNRASDNGSKIQFYKV